MGISPDGVKRTEVVMEAFSPLSICFCVLYLKLYLCCFDWYLNDMLMDGVQIYFLGLFPLGFYTMTDLLPFTPIEFIKIYIGQLPLNLEEHHLKEILEPLAELKEVKVIKGDQTRGRFDLFCYAFVTIKGNQATAHHLINTLQQHYPSWKMNVKFDQNKRNNKPFPPINMPYPPQQPLPYQPYPPMHRPPYPPYQPHTILSNNYPSSSQKIIGNKPCRILVRELWLGGIPQNFQKGQMAQIMSYYGIVQDIEIFPKFAFIKYKQASQATVAFERAEEISMRLGHPQGFRIFFSDPSRRAYIVSNHYEYDRQSPSLPILFIGYPPITSGTVEMEAVKPVCEKYGNILNQYMRKNTNSQNRSYFLFTFDNIKNAIRAKQELNKRKDTLGDKRVEVSLLLDEQIILKGHDLSHTEKLFQDSNQRSKKNYYNNNMDNNMKPMMPMQMNYPPSMYPNYPHPPFIPYYPHPQPPQPHYYYDPSFYKTPEEGEMYPNHQPQQPPHNQSEINDHIHQFLRDVLSEKTPTNEKKPVKSGEVGRQQDILSKLLGNEAKLTPQVKESKESHKEKEDRQPAWSGFLTWKSLKRVAVDGFSQSMEMQDYAINIISLIEFKDIVMKERNFMVLQPSNSISSNIFKEYIKQLKNRVGVAMNSKHLMYIMPKNAQSDKIQPINQDELLVVLEKASFLTQIKDKLIKCQELP